MATEAAAPGDLYQVVVAGTLEEQECLNVWDFKCLNGDSDVNLHLILVFINCFITNLLPVLSNNYVLNEVRWKKVSPSLGIEHVTIPAGAGPGQNDGDGLPSYVSAVMSKHTLLGGRSHRGRVYIGGIPESDTTGSLINIEPPNAALWTALLAFAACVVSAFVHPDPAGGSNIWNVGVYSRKIGGATFPFSPTGFTSMTEIVPHRELATTRSRKIGRGR
jgi:hypothetical protein